MKLDELKQHFTAEELRLGHFGIEREGLRVTPDGSLTDTPHPLVFGDKIKNPYITTDFSESQVEVITPPYDTVHRAHKALEGLCDIVNNEIRPYNEFIWPGSMPCIAPEDDAIPIAVYAHDQRSEEARHYRESLIKKYGGKKQLITGIHFNFSFTDAFLEKYRKLTAPHTSMHAFRDEVYLKIVRNYLRYRWLIIYLTGCSTAFHKTYNCLRSNIAREAHGDAFVMENGVSIRNSGCGYKNLVDLFPDYSSVRAYVQDVKSFVDAGFISHPKELYTQIRMKSGEPEHILESLIQDGIRYIELRTIDLNAFDKCGVAERDLVFTHLFLLTMLFMDEPQNEPEDWQAEALYNENKTAGDGLVPGLKLKRGGIETPFADWAVELIEETRKVNDAFGLGYEQIINEMKTRVEQPSTTYAASIQNIVAHKGFIPAMMNFAKAYREDSWRFRYQYRGFESYELSTQILLKEAMTRGVKIEELDPKDNFISLEANGKKEYVKQATKTSADNYVTVLAMENKVVTKKILKDHGITVPGGSEYTGLEALRAAVSTLVGKPVVIKPKSTNYGLGIFIFENGGSEQDLLRAAQTAFTYDDTILVEDFLPGQEYRFLVINGETAAVMNRVAANVVGDGSATIRELIQLKNEHPFRGEHYETPLENIKIDEQTKIFLKNQGLTPDSVPEKDKRIYLRGNSNISTGGDSVDMTDQMPEVYKRVAEEAAQAIGAVFCGVDMIIEDYTNPESTFGIIELNFNPATHMHAYPLEGKERRTGAYILSALGLIDEKPKDIDRLP